MYEEGKNHAWKTQTGQKKNLQMQRKITALVATALLKMEERVMQLEGRFELNDTVKDGMKKLFKVSDIRNSEDHETRNSGKKYCEVDPSFQGEDKNASFKKV
jgi:hypothetical protein